MSVRWSEPLVIMRRIAGEPSPTQKVAFISHPRTDQGSGKHTHTDTHRQTHTLTHTDTHRHTQIHTDTLSMYRRIDIGDWGASLILVIRNTKF